MGELSSRLNKTSITDYKTNIGKGKTKFNIFKWYESSSYLQMIHFLHHLQFFKPMQHNYPGNMKNIKLPRSQTKQVGSKKVKW